MTGDAKMLWRGARPLIGTMVGVGIFALPYAFAKAGFGVGLIELLVIAILNSIVLFLYADLVMARDGHGRFIGVVGKHLGSLGKALVAVAYLAMQFGTMIAYVIAGGTFAYAIGAPLVGGNEMIYHLGFWLLSSSILFGGLAFVSKVQGYLIPAFCVLVFILALVAQPFFRVENLASFHFDHMFLPLGVVLFAFGGLSAIPEMRDILGKQKWLLRRSVVLGAIFVLMLYAIFSLVVVGVTGEGTTLQAIDGLGKIVGPTILLIGSFIGLFAVFSAYITVGVAQMDTFMFDYKIRSLLAWSVTIGFPLLAYLIGARSFIGVIGFTGGVLSSILGMLLIFSYERARYAHDLPKRALAIPQWLVGLVFIMYVGMLGLTMAQFLFPAPLWP